MSFSRKVKQELEAVTEETAIHCKMAQLAAMIAECGCFKNNLRQQYSY